MSLRPLHLLLTALLLVFAADASLNVVAARTTHGKKSADSKSSRKAGEASGPALVIRGDIVTSRGLIKAIADAYEDAGEGRVTVEPFSTISGIDAALSGNADIAASARPGFASRAQEAGLNFTPVAWDALVMITHPSNPVNNLTLRQLHAIYFGKITNWRELGGRDAPIDLYTVASPLDGAEYSLRRLLYKRGDQPVMMPRMYVNVAKLEEGVAIDPNSLGLSTLSGIFDNKDVKAIPIEGVAPTLDTVADGSYPLYSAIYLASSPDSPHAAEIAKFMAFLSSDKATKLMREHDLLPYAQATTLDAQNGDQRLQAISDRMVGEGLPPPRVIASAPGATYSHLASVAPGSERTAEARVQLEAARAAERERRGVPATENAQLAASNAQQAAGLAQQAADKARTAGTPIEAHQAAAVSQQAAHEAQTEALQAEATTDSAHEQKAVGRAEDAASTATSAADHARAAAGDTTTPAPAQAMNRTQAIAPSNPVVLSANGSVTPVTPGAVTDHPATHTVVKGDTLSAIARKYSVSVTDLHKWNDLKGDELAVGQVLQLSAGH